MLCDSRRTPRGWGRDHRPCPRKLATYYTHLSYFVSFLAHRGACFSTHAVNAAPNRVNSALVSSLASVPLASNSLAALLTYISGCWRTATSRNTSDWRRWWLAPNPPSAPGETLTTAPGLPAPNALLPYGREAMSMAFFSTPGTERLYSGVANR